MKKRLGQYIVYVNQEYFKSLCDKRGICTHKEGDVLFSELMNVVNDFIRGENGDGTLFAFSFIDKNGNRTKSIEISPLLSADSPKTLHYIRKMNRRKKR